ncbi:MAG: methyltransferase domain-containing protein, partial [Bacteroidota bacterium]|nr:methyltransferase domain-containing protein [Bacteroidota bacterium]
MNDFRRRLYEQPPVDAGEGTAKGNERSGRKREDFFEYAIFPFLRDIPRHARILEIGCGSGEFLEYMRKKGYECIRGIDISAERTAQA